MDPDIPSSSTLDADDNGVLEKSQLAMFEYATDELATIDVRLVVLGQWYFDGPAHGVGVHQESDRTPLCLMKFTYFHLQLSRHIHVFLYHPRRPFRSPKITAPASRAGTNGSACFRYTPNKSPFLTVTQSIQSNEAPS